MVDAVRPDSMKAGVTQDDFQGISRRWVFGENRFDIFSNRPEHRFPLSRPPPELGRYA